MSNRHRRNKLRSRRRTRNRYFESLEPRLMLAVDWRNPVNPFDVNNDNSVFPIDALQIINVLNSKGPHTLPAVRPSDGSQPYLDVSGDNVVAPIDVLQVINVLIAGNSGSAFVLREADFVSEFDFPITLGQTSGARHYRLALDAVLGDADSATSIDDVFNLYLVDPQDRSKTLLDQGTPGTALFSKIGQRTEMATGLVRFDGDVIDIDLSSLGDRETGLLRLQYINGNTQAAGQVSVRPLSNDVDAEATPGARFNLNSPLSRIGDATDLSTYLPLANPSIDFSQVRFDSTSGLLQVEVRLKAGETTTGRNVALTFPGLPSSVELRNRSGTTSAGVPYVNLQPAIPNGGLSRGITSRSILLEFANPSRAHIDLKPTVVSLGNNRAPIIAPIGNLSVLPGDTLHVPISATDADGDSVTFSLQSDQRLPNGFLSAAGNLTFSPAPSDIGTYQFNIRANDGTATSTQAITLEVEADPITTTRVSGIILDIHQMPLSGMQVEIGAVQGLTMPDGRFTLDLGSGPLVSDTIKIRGELFPGPQAYPFIAEKLPLVLEHNVFAGVNNVIDRPIYLPALDMANGVTINPALDTTVTTAAVPGAEVMVKAGTLMNQQGTPFTGALSITEVPPNLTPAALPEGLLPDLVVTIQPGEMVFATPAPLSLPNRAGWAPGTKMDLWSISPITGEFEIVGEGRVSTDGSLVETISGGIRNSSWHAFILQAIDTEVSVDEPECDEDRMTCPAQSRVDLHSGAIIERHAVARYYSQGKSRSLNFVYNSLHADTRPIIQFMSTFQCVFGSTGGGVQRLVAELSVEQNGTTSSLSSGFWSLPSCSAGISVQLGGSLIADMSRFPSGQYQFHLKTGTLTGNSNAPIAGRLITSSPTVSIVNLASSSLGSGWAIMGVQEIVEHVDGSLLLIDGSSATQRFGAPPAVGQPYVSPLGDFSTMERLADGTFRRTLKDQAVFQFNADNKLAFERDRNGNTTQYRYTAGRLTDIIDPVQLTTHFEYTGGLLTSVTNPYGRVTRFEHDERGNLTRIIEPDGAATSWEYDDRHHPISMTDANGNRGEDVFDELGRVIAVKFPDGSAASVSPVQSQSVAIEGRNTSWQTAATPIADRVATYVDSKGNAIRATLDLLGQPTKIEDSLGSVSATTRNALNLIVQRFDARGNVTAYDYDDRGNVVRVTDVVSTVMSTPTSSWIGGGSGQWNDSANWSDGRVPGPEDDVLIEVPNVDAEITISGQPVQVRGLYSFERITINGQSLTITGESRLFNEVSLRSNAVLLAKGAEADVSLLSTVPSGGNYRAEQSGTLRLPLLTTMLAGSFNVQTGGVIEAPALQRLVNVRVDIATGASLSVGQIEEFTLGTLTIAGGAHEFTNLTAFQENTLILQAGAVVTMPNLASIDRSTLQIVEGSRLTAGSLAGFNNSSITLTSLGSVSIPNLTDVTGSSFYVKGQGTRFTMPAAVTSHDSGTTRVDRFFQVEDGGLLDLSSLTSLTSNSQGWTTYFRAYGGGTLLMPNLTALTNHSVTVRAEGSGSQIDLSGLTTWQGQFPNGRRSSLTGLADTTINVPALTSLDQVDVTLSGAGTLTTGQITSIVGGSIVTTGRAIDLSGLTSFTDSALSVQAGGSVLTPNLTDVTGSSFYVKGQGTRFTMPAAVTSHDSGATRVDRFFQVEDGGLLDLSSLTSLTSNSQGWTTYFRAYGGGTLLMPNLTALTNHSVTVRAEGSGSQIDLSGLTTWQGQFPNGRRSSLTGLADTTINVPALTSLDRRRDAVGRRNLDYGQITSIVGGSIVTTGRRID
ncbi:MAG: hypothetical protein H6823_10725 [Planctomycetaceae bacterium]|nr:hypothetical protein [Planctomycetaceae bacterium]